MLERDWRLFLRDGSGKEIAIAQVPMSIVGYLGATSDKLFLHHTYAMKAAEKHGLSPALFSTIFDIVEFGVAISDKPSHVTFFYLVPEVKRWFQVSIKCPEDSKRLYLVTFHRVGVRKVRNKVEKFEVIKK